MLEWYHSRMVFQDIKYFRRFVAVRLHDRGHARGALGRVLTVSKQASYRILAQVSCQYHHLGHASQRRHVLDASLTAAGHAQRMQEQDGGHRVRHHHSELACI